MEDYTHLEVCCEAIIDPIIKISDYAMLKSFKTSLNAYELKHSSKISSIVDLLVHRELDYQVSDLMSTSPISIIYNTEEDGTDNISGVMTFTATRMYESLTFNVKFDVSYKIIN